MLSHVSWPQFWLFMIALVAIYYVIIGLVYFRSEALTWVSGRVHTKQPTPGRKTPLSRKASIIGAYEAPQEESIEKVNVITVENATQINEALRQELLLSPEFIAQVNAGLEDETLEALESSRMADHPVLAPSMDAEDFIEFIKNGMAELTQLVQPAIEKTAFIPEVGKTSDTGTSIETENSTSEQSIQPEREQEGNPEEAAEKDTDNAPTGGGDRKAEEGSVWSNIRLEDLAKEVQGVTRRGRPDKVHNLVPSLRRTGRVWATPSLQPISLTGMDGAKGQTHVSKGHF